MTPAEKMARARAKVRPGRRSHDHQTQLDRTMALPSVNKLGLTAEEREEQVLSLAQAADLLEVSFQAVAQAVLRGTLPAYRDGHRRVVLADDLAETQTTRAQAAEADELAQAQAEHARRLDAPWPGVYECAGPFEECLCNPALQAEWDRQGDEPVERRPASPKLREHLARIRVKARATQLARAQAQAADIASVRAQLAQAGQASDD
jgi:hypothetical protein